MLKNRITSLFISLVLIVGFFISNCSKNPTEPEQPPDAIIPETTKVLDQTSMNQLVSKSGDDSIFVFNQSSQIIDQLAIGNVIVSGMSDKAPDGFLRRIERVTSSGNQITAITSQATLEDAIQKGSFSIEKTLGPQDLASNIVLAKGVVLNEEKLNYGEFYYEIDVVLLRSGNKILKAIGNIRIEPSFNFSLDIDHFKLTEFLFTNTTVQTSELQIKGELEFYSLKEEIKIAHIPFQPIVVFVGIVPIVIQPLLTIDVGIDGSASVAVIAKVQRESTLTAGIEYQNGNWNAIKEITKSYTPFPLQIAPGCNFKGYIGPQMNMLLYGVAGPYVDLNGYLEIEADAFATPWWEFYAGVEAGVGVQVRFLGRTIGEDFYVPGVIGFRQLLAAAQDVLKGTIQGTVKDAITGNGLNNVTINVSKDNVPVTSDFSDASGSFSIELQAATGYLIKFSKTGYLPVDYNNVTVGGNSSIFLEPILQIDANYSGDGNIAGYVVNALNGAGVANLSLSLRQGLNNQTGTAIRTSSTDHSGFYSFINVPAGNYTVEAAGTGYNTTYFSVISIGGQTTGNQNATITPILNENEIRIILNWGVVPDDLDSHLTGPLSDGSRFHMFYPLAQANDGSPWPAYVQLDLDDITSYGPETTTIYQQIGGLYRFSIHDYTNREASRSFALSNSNAQVRVYKGSTLLQTFYVPNNTEGTLWTVFELFDDTIRPINAMSYESDPGAVTKSAIQTDAHLIRNLPEKKHNNTKTKN